MSATVFEPPIRGTRHCRHYSWEPGLRGGPRCAAGVDLARTVPVAACVPEPKAECSKREEYTDAERSAWRAWRDASMARLAKAIEALPAPIPLRTSGKVPCPNCGGELHYGRWHRGAEIKCSTPNCCGAHFSIEAGKDWPSPKPEAGS